MRHPGRPARHHDFDVGRALDEDKKERWACVACRILSRLVQKDHCRDQIKSVPMQLGNSLRALAGLLALAFLLFEIAKGAALAAWFVMRRI